MNFDKDKLKIPKISIMNEGGNILSSVRSQAFKEPKSFSPKKMIKKIGRGDSTKMSVLTGFSLALAKQVFKNTEAAEVAI